MSNINNNQNSLDKNIGLLDSLIYASIKNKVKDDDTMHYYSQTIEDDSFDPMGPYSEQWKILDNMVDNTTIKRACCLGKDNIDVRIPIPKKILNDIESNNFDNANLDLMKSIGFFDKRIEIPKGRCPDGYSPSSKQCDNFYVVYCKNSLENFKKTLNGKTYDHDEFIKYKPECGCYGDLSAFGNNIPSTFPRKCVFSGCGPSSPSYVDPSSRKESCSLNVCQSIISAANATVGGNINIKANIAQNCGLQNTDDGTTTSMGVAIPGQNNSTTQTTTKPSNNTTQSTTQSTTKPSNNTTTQSTTQSTTKPSNNTTTQSTTQTTTKPSNNNTTQSTTKPSNNSTTQSTTKPSNNTTTQSATKPSNNTTTQSTTQATTKPSTTQSTTKPSNNSTAQSNTQSNTQTTTKPSNNSTTQSTTKPSNNSTTQSNTQTTNNTNPESENSNSIVYMTASGGITFIICCCVLGLILIALGLITFI